MRVCKWRPPRLTLLGRALLILLAELVANLLVWAISCGLFIPDPGKRRIMSLALVAWTLGLRHGLDVDHISAIDNATRHLVALGQLPLTVGTFFSLGHSTIVIAVTTAIAISTDIADHLDGVSSVGGVIGVSVSASFLLLIGIINAFILAQTLRQRRQDKSKRRAERRSDVEESDSKSSGEGDAAHPPVMLGCIARIAKPLFKMIDRPWKMYPIGILFGIGFDTSSEIALLAVSALAKNNPATPGIANSEIIILPFIFTAGMSLVDCADSVFMLFAYAMPRRSDLGISGRQWTIFQHRSAVEVVESATEAPPAESQQSPAEPQAKDPEEPRVAIEEAPPADSVRLEHIQAIKTSTVSSLSILLTIISIVVALFISIVEFMGLAAQECASCAEAADFDPGLAGRWWRFWNALNDDSGYLGAGVVAFMVAVVVVWVLWGIIKKRRRRVQCEDEHANA